MTDPWMPGDGWDTPESTGPARGLAFAGPGARLVAYIVDAIILGIATSLLIALAAALVFTVPMLAILPAVAIVVVPLIYFPYYWSRDGQTPGLKMMGIRVVRDRDGGPITSGQAILRLIGYWVSGFFFGLGYLWILIDRRKRGWHDLIAGTVVVEAAKTR
jgi:uncharacterized RDD family membrane protein YckC